MKRSIFSCALAIAMLAGASVGSAKEYEFQFGGTAATTSGDVATYGESAAGYGGEGYCPDGSCAPGKHGHGKHGNGYGYGSGYPNGRDNYGQLGSYCGYSPPGGHCRAGWVGDCQYRWYGQPDLFYNYYAWPSCTGVGAELYVSPRPVPPHVGHTFVTYQPLMPHEFLYEHKRTYHRYYNGGQGLNRTHVKWYHVPW
jgi:uncharacterized low-complexity protein